MRRGKSCDTTKRNFGIDALRLVAMYMIVLLHVLKHGGILQHATGLSFAVVWLLETVAICAVNCYAMISGYVGFEEEERQYRYYKFSVLWLSVCFYSIIFSLGISIYTGNLCIKTIFMVLFPVTTSQYWYFTGYTCVFFVAPWINKLLRCLSPQDKKRFTVVFCVFLMYITVASILFDPFGTQGGYSFLWLMSMYIVGALLKNFKFLDKIKRSRVMLIGGVCVVLGWCLKLIIPTQNILITYTSPTTVCLTICLLIVFSKMKLSSGSQKIVRVLTPATFGVYLIHDNNAVRNAFIMNKFTWIMDYPVWLQLALILTCALVIYLMCLGIDVLRIKLFYHLRVGETCERIENRIRELWVKILNNVRDEDCNVKKNKIKVFLAAYINYPNAQNINCEHIARYLDKDKFQVHAMYTDRMPIDKKKYKKQGVRLHRLIHHRYIWFWSKLFVMWRVNADIYYMPKSEQADRFFALRNKGKGKVFIASIEGVVTQHILNSPLEREYFFDVMDESFVISNCIAESVKKYWGMDMHILPLGVDALCEELPEKTELKKVIWIGNIKANKRPHHLIECAQRFPQLQFTMVGDGDMDDEIHHAITEKGLTNVICTGRIPNDEVYEYLKQSDLLLMTSEYEGLPKVIQEAAQCGVPSIYIGENYKVDFIVDGVNGYDVVGVEQMIDKILYLLEHPIEYQKISRSVEESIKPYEWKHLIRQYELYFETMARKYNGTDNFSDV